MVIDEVPILYTYWCSPDLRSNSSLLFLRMLISNAFEKGKLVDEASSRNS